MNKILVLLVLMIYCLLAGCRGNDAKVTKTISLENNSKILNIESVSEEVPFSFVKPKITYIILIDKYTGKKYLLGINEQGDIKLNDIERE